MKKNNRSETNGGATRPKRAATAQVRRRRLWLILAAAVFFLFIAPMTVTGIIYEKAFRTHYLPDEATAYRVEEFDGLTAERRDFDSGTNRLAGTLYRVGTDAPKGLVVIVHGLGGGGQRDYMDQSYRFAKEGYLVFAFDATGVGDSEGKGVRGFPQIVKDLDCAIGFAEAQPEAAGLPVFLYGHSWGAYASGAVLNFRSEVKAVVSLSGFDSSALILRENGIKLAGPAVKLGMPYLRLYEWLKFGKYAPATASRGFEKTDARLLIVQSRDDENILPAYGYERYQKALRDDARVQFILYENRGHERVYITDEARSYLENFEARYAAFVTALDRAPSVAEERAFIEANLDRTLFCNMADPELFEQIFAMFDAAR